MTVDALVWALDLARVEHEMATARDAAVIETLRSERDTFSAQLRTATAERDDLRAKLDAAEAGGWRQCGRRWFHADGRYIVETLNNRHFGYGADGSPVRHLSFSTESAVAEARACDWLDFPGASEVEP